MGLFLIRAPGLPGRDHVSCLQNVEIEPSVVVTTTAAVLPLLPMPQAQSVDLRCVLVEDQAMIAQLLAERLDQLSGLQVVAIAHTAAAGIEACVEQRPDLLLLDLSLPDGPGIRVAETLQVLRPDARLIVVSGQASSFLCPEHLAPMLLAVVDKTGSCADLIEEISLLLPAPTALAGQAESVPAERLHSLTPRQRQILRMIGQGASSRDAAQQLGVSLETVNTHRRQIAARLGIRGAALVRYAVLHADHL